LLETYLEIRNKKNKWRGIKEKKTQRKDVLFIDNSTIFILCVTSICLREKEKDYKNNNVSHFDLKS